MKKLLCVLSFFGFVAMAVIVLVDGFTGGFYEARGLSAFFMLADGTPLTEVPGRYIAYSALLLITPIIFLSTVSSLKGIFWETIINFLDYVDQMFP